MIANPQLRHALGLLTAIILTLFLLYVSRFWIWTAPWSGDGLFGAKFFSPYGNLVQGWLNGTWISEFNIVVWGCSAILTLSSLHWVAGRIFR